MTSTRAAGLDFMAIGAHADDVELGAGGTLLRLATLGRKGLIVDLTDASLGTRGTPALRAREAAAAARLLKTARVNLGLPDGRLSDPALNGEAEARLIAAIRRHRPRILLTHHEDETHPDHGAAARLVKQAAFKAGLAKADAPGAPFRPGRIFRFIGETLHEPSFCVDITDHWKPKLRAVLAYRSLFVSGDGRPGKEKSAPRIAGRTDLATPAFLENLEVRNRFWGIRIRRRYAEAFVCDELPEVDDISALGGERFP
jgi:bacillithiol biosynthesis deacetylase BshB1